MCCFWCCFSAEKQKILQNTDDFHVSIPIFSHYHKRDVAFCIFWTLCCLAIEVFSDSSLSRFGFCFNRENLAGSWLPQDLAVSNNSINGLELLTIFKGLSSFATIFRGKSILVRCDNVTVVQYLNNMGGLHSPSCNSLAEMIWNFCF